MDKLPSYCGFSVVVANESGVVLRRDISSPEEIADLARSSNAEAVAIDNIYEIGSESDIRRFTTMLYKADLIQVTGSPSAGFKPLPLVAKELGLASGSLEKLSPSRAAEVCARAVMAGRGYIVKVYDPETKVTISKRRKFGTGGMSEARYRRSVQGSVLSLSNTIRSALDSRKIDYDLTWRKGSHGVEGSSFYVYASRNKLFGVVRPIRTSSISVKIMPFFTKSFDFASIGGVEEGPPRRYLIVGVDPGMVTGLAVIDLNGRVLLASSGRGITRGQITRTLARFGRALVFSTDVNPTPAALIKLAASHNALLFTPEKSMKTEEKKDMVARLLPDQGVKAEDTHQRDSLAAALKAFAFYRNKLEQAAAHARRQDRVVQLDEVKANVLRGMSISDALEASRAPVFEEAVSRKKGGSEGEQIKVLKAKVEEFRGERDSLLDKIRGLEERIEDLENDLRLAKLERKPQRSRETEIYELERRVRSLQGETMQLRALMEAARSENFRMRSAMELLALGNSVIIRRYKNVAEFVRERAGEYEKDAKGDAEKIALVERVGYLPEHVQNEFSSMAVPALIAEEMSQIERAQFMGMGVPVIVLSSAGSILTSEEYPTVRLFDKNLLGRSVEAAKKELQEFSSVKGAKLRNLLEEYKKERIKEIQ